jgi:hypothetical protein
MYQHNRVLVRERWLLDLGRCPHSGTTNAGDLGSQAPTQSEAGVDACICIGSLVSYTWAILMSTVLIVPASL